MCDMKLPSDDPRVIAFKHYRESTNYQNVCNWAKDAKHVDGSLWHAFIAGRDSLQAELAELRATVEQLQPLADYAQSVRMDRWTIEDDCVLCLQTEEWCRGLLAAADAARGSE